MIQPSLWTRKIGLIPIGPTEIIAMPYLLDTCTLFWLSGDKKSLSAEAGRIIEKNATDLFVSAISAFEFGVKGEKGIFRFSVGVEEWFRKTIKFYGVSSVPINFQIASQSTMLPPIHRDPCDRIIIATAKEYDMKILTPDQHIRQYDETRCLW